MKEIVCESSSSVEKRLEEIAQFRVKVKREAQKESPDAWQNIVCLVTEVLTNCMHKHAHDLWFKVIIIENFVWIQAPSLVSNYSKLVEITECYCEVLHGIVGDERGGMGTMYLFGMSLFFYYDEDGTLGISVREDDDKTSPTPAVRVTREAQSFFLPLILAPS